MARESASRLDADNPWPGLDSFSEQDVDYFHGRESETAELLRLVRRESVTVLFGGSGLGKTSLLNAGLFPVLREQGFVPAYVRVDFTDDGPPPRAQVLDALLAECEARGVEAPSPQPSDTLWEYFHRVDTEFWNARNKPVTPVIALDQFEEVFTLGRSDDRSRARAEAFLVELGDLIENRTPRHLKAAMDEDPELARRYDFRKTDFKLSLSFREDYLAHIEGLKHQMPSLTYNRLRLTPMDGDQALEVIVDSGGHLVEDGVPAIIIAMAAGRGSAEDPPPPEEYPDLEIDPALLMVICAELNGRRPRGGKITRQLISGAGHEILSDFYERSMQGRDPQVRIFVEDELLTDKGYRDSFARDDAIDLPGVSEADVNALVAGRLLRVDDRFGVQRLELTHDVLTKVVRDSRDTRKARERELAAQAREQEAARRQRRYRIYATMLGIAAVGVLAAGWYVLELRKTAIEASALARASEHAANEASARAIELKESANELLDRARSTQLVTQAERFQDRRYDLSLLLNVEAARRASTLDARAGFLHRFLSHPHLEAFLPGQAAQFAVSVDPRGRFIASAGIDHTIQLWDPATRTALEPLRGHDAEVLALAVSADGTLLASGGADNAVMLWDVAARKVIASFEGHENRVLGVAFSPDGTLLASAGYDGRLRLWDVSSGSPRGNVEAHGGRSVLAVSFRPDGSMLASAGGDQRVALWDPRTLQPLGSLPAQGGAGGHDDRVLGIAFSPNGRRLASAGGDKRVKLWNPDSGELALTLDGHSRAVRSVAFHPDGRRLATASDDNTVKLWDLDEKIELLSLEGHRDAVQGVAFRPGGDRLVSAGDDGNLILWDPQARIASRTLRGHTDQVQDLDFGHDGKRIASTGDDRNVILWDVDSGTPSAVLEGHERRVRNVEFSADDRRLISAGDDKTLMVWEISTGEARHRLDTGGSVLALAYSPDGTRVASGGRDKRVTLWDTVSWQPVGALEAPDWVWSVSFSPDGRLLASAHRDNSVSLWDVSALARIASATGHDDSVRGVAFSPDGRLLASAGEDRKVVLWQVAGLVRQAVLTGHEDFVLGVAFGPEGKTLASASRDRNVMLWDVAEGKPLVTLAAHIDDVTSVAVSGDGATIASASKDQTLMLWTWGLDELAADACAVANRNLSCDEWRQYMGSVAYRKTCDAAPAAAGGCR